MKGESELHGACDDDMSLSNYKITDAAIAQKGVVAAPDKLTGTAAQNKAVFDRLIREAVRELFNGLIDALSGDDGAAEVGTTAIDGVTGGDVQTVLGSLKTLLDTKSASADVSAALSLKSDKATTNLHLKAVSFDAETGIFTFTREDGSYVTIDTVLEKVATNWQYDAATQSLLLTLADGTTQRVPLSAFITETEFADSASIAFSVSNHTVSATVKAGGITDAMLSSALVTQLRGYVSDAADSASDAGQSESAAALHRTAAAGSAANAAASAQAAASSASAASGSAAAAKNSAEAGEAWAVGQRNGADVPATDVTYHNNARYWAGKAQQAAGGGVISFNERAGIVAPQSGDYTAEMIDGFEDYVMRVIRLGLHNALRFSADEEFVLETANGQKNWNGILEWTDGESDWAEWDGTSISSGKENKLYVRGTGNTYITNLDLPRKSWKVRKKDYPVPQNAAFRCTGNIEMLLDYATAAAGGHPQMAAQCFRYMFYDTGIVQAPDLNAITLSEYCYADMFTSCKALKDPPVIRATTLARGCCSNMFSNTEMEKIVIPPAKVMAESCYAGMYSNSGVYVGEAYDAGWTPYPFSIPPTMDGTDATNALNSMFQNYSSPVAAPTLNRTYYSCGEVT